MTLDIQLNNLGIWMDLSDRRVNPLDGELIRFTKTAWESLEVEYVFYTKASKEIPTNIVQRVYFIEKDKNVISSLFEEESSEEVLNDLVLKAMTFHTEHGLVVHHSDEEKVHEFLRMLRVPSRLINL